MLTEKINSNLYINSKENYIDEIHLNSKGFITVASIREGKYNQYHYKYNKEILNAISETNGYITLNTFYKPQRRLENIKELKHLYIDIDCYNTNYTKDAVLYFLEKDFYNKKIPMPNMIIDSGRGLYLIWNIETVPYKVLPLWNAIEKYLYKTLKEFGADAKATDATRILRVVGTINSKTNTMVEILDKHDYTYTLKEIQNEYLPELQKKPKKAKGRPKKVVSLFNTYNLHYDRFNDLIRLCKLRKYDVKGMREHILFLYRYWTCCFIADAQQALKMTLELNEKFKQPLRLREVERATQSAERAYLNKDKKYNYKNSTLIELLEITEEEQEQLKTIIGTVEKYRRKNEIRNNKRRNDEGLTKREQEKTNKIKTIQELKTQGLTQKEIAKEMKISERMIRKYIKQIKEKM